MLHMPLIDCSGFIQRFKFHFSCEAYLSISAVVWSRDFGDISYGKYPQEKCCQRRASELNFLAYQNIHFTRPLEPDDTNPKWTDT